MLLHSVRIKLFWMQSVKFKTYTLITYSYFVAIKEILKSQCWKPKTLNLFHVMISERDKKNIVLHDLKKKVFSKYILASKWGCYPRIHSYWDLFPILHLPKNILPEFQNQTIHVSAAEDTISEYSIRSKSLLFPKGWKAIRT